MESTESALLSTAPRVFAVSRCTHIVRYRLSLLSMQNLMSPIFQLIGRIGLVPFFGMALMFVAAKANAQVETDPDLSNGKLFIHGGGSITQLQRSRFVAMAGGRSAKFVVVPTAQADDKINEDEIKKRFAKNWHVNNVTVLHTRDPNVANSAEFVEALKSANGVWLEGGRQWRYADAYLDTEFHKELFAALRRGAVIGGSSAGASMIASFLVRGSPGTTRNPEGDNRKVIAPGYTRGFGLLPESAIDQHVDARNRTDDLNDVIKLNPKLLGVGIDQGAAVTVFRNTLTVTDGSIAIWNAADRGSADSYVLRDGDTFDLLARVRKAR